MTYDDLLVPCGARHIKTVDGAPPDFRGPMTVILECAGPGGHVEQGQPTHIAMFGAAWITWEDGE